VVRIWPEAVVPSQGTASDALTSDAGPDRAGTVSAQSCVDLVHGITLS
jgi:hypothetical protein